MTGSGHEQEPPTLTPSVSVEQSLGPDYGDDAQLSSQVAPAAIPFQQSPLPDGFDFGSLCFFKIRNHPYWPGRISGAGMATDTTMKVLRGKGVVVLSFGNHDYEVVSPDSIVPFRDYLRQKPKRLPGKALRSAIKEAMRVQSGELVLDESTLEIDESVRGRGKRHRTSVVPGSASSAEQRKEFRRKILSQLGLFPPDVLLSDYGLA